jgi:hypothetical protein
VDAPDLPLTNSLIAAMLCEAIFGPAGRIMDSEAAGNPR